MSASHSQRTRWTIGLAFAVAIGAMIRHPGGTALDPATPRYSLSHNFLSDLGMTVAYNHQPNRLGAGLFVLSLLLLVGYAVLLTWGPNVTTVDGLVIQVIAQKIAAVFGLVTLLFAAQEVDRAQKPTTVKDRA